MAALLCESALRALFLGALVWCMLRMLRVTSAAQERTAWLVVLCASALMPVIALVMRDIAKVPSADFVLPVSMRETIGSVFATAVVRPAWRDDVLHTCGLAYLCVATVLLARLWLGVVAAWILWRRAVPIAGVSTNSVRVRCSPRIGTPATVGRGVLLPADWTEWSQSALTSVLAHESSHVSRGDFFWQLLARGYCAILWASPLSWWLLRRLTMLSEHLSDAAAIRSQRGAAHYATLLLEFARAERTGFLMVGMARRSMIVTRVEWILREASTPPRPHKSYAGVVVGVACAMLLSFAVPRVTLRASAVATIRQEPVAPLSALTVRRLAPLSTPLSPLSPQTSLRLAPSATSLSPLQPFSPQARLR
jgi:BlaR1 peptidase M56